MEALEQELADKQTLWCEERRRLEARLEELSLAKQKILLEVGVTNLYVEKLVLSRKLIVGGAQSTHNTIQERLERRLTGKREVTIAEAKILGEEDESHVQFRGLVL